MLVFAFKSKIANIILLVLISLICSTYSFLHSVYRTNSRHVNNLVAFKLYGTPDNNWSGKVPSSSFDLVNQQKANMLKSLIAATFGVTIAKVAPASAIGGLYELKNQRMCLQDISLNVPNTKLDALLLSDTLQQTIKVISDKFVKGESTTVMAFGPRAYQSPKSFTPGISSYFEDGGHATITFKDKVDLQETLGSGSAVVEVFEPGNGLEYIKFGTEVLRLSKAIAAGSVVKYAYGWVDLVTPSGVPYEFVVGIARDPIMTAFLRVENMKASVDFFKNSLGMMELPFNFARQPGSNFEKQPEKGGVYLGYSNNTLGLYLIPSKEKVNVGSVLNAFTIVVDDDLSTLPIAVKETVEGAKLLLSPDGYPFKFQLYSDYVKSDLCVKEFTSVIEEKMSLATNKMDDDDEQETESIKQAPIRKKTKFGRDGQSNQKR